MAQILVDKIFLIQLVASFIVGGAYIAFTTWISERFGTKVGGLVVGLPSTLMISLIFIAITQDASAAVSAIPVVPAAIAINSLFVVVFILFYKYGVKFAFGAGVLLWFILALPLVWLRLDNLGWSLVLAVIFFGIAISFLQRFSHQKLPAFQFTYGQFLFRAGFAGAMVALAVFLGKALGPLWGGLFASFPAAFSSAILLLARAHGVKFASSVARTMPFGSIGNIVFAVAFFFLVPLYGMIWGLVFAYILSLASAIIMYSTIMNR